MTLNQPESKLKDLIVVEEGLIPKNICDYIIQDIETRQWTPHTWYNAQTGALGSESTKELDVQSTTEELQALITPYMISAGASYNQKVSFEGGGDRTCQIMNKFSKVRFNRYAPGQIMRKHWDHISLWGAGDHGIPTLSVIICFNDDYGGGELVFWDDYKVKPKAGSLILWPSLFLYPHGVEEVTSGIRYSGVLWCW